MRSPVQHKSTGRNLPIYRDDLVSALPYKNNRPESVAQRQIQRSADSFVVQRKAVNHTGLPNNLKTGIEQMSGLSMDDVRVHYNSDKPAQLQAHAFAQGTDIHLASGQEKHLPHEAWHVVQQKQGRVKPTIQLKTRVKINDDPNLEHEADAMGARALQFIQVGNWPHLKHGVTRANTVQRTRVRIFRNEYDTDDARDEDAILDGLSEMHAEGQITALHGILGRLERDRDSDNTIFIERLHEVLRYGGLSAALNHINAAYRADRDRSAPGRNYAMFQLKIDDDVVEQSDVITPGLRDHHYSKVGRGRGADRVSRGELEISARDSEVELCRQVFAAVRANRRDEMSSVTVNVTSWLGPCDGCKRRFATLKRDIQEATGIVPDNIKIQVFYKYKDLDVVRGRDSTTNYGYHTDDKVEHTGIYGHLY